MTLLTYGTNFNHLTTQRYAALGKRVAPFELPFTLAEYRSWLASHFAGTTTRCFYCNWPISLETVVVDHKTPSVQCGSLHFDNMCLTCKSCNDQKGSRRAEAVILLRTLCNNSTLFTPTDRDSVLGRLQSSIKLAIREQRRRAGEARTRQPNVRVMPHVRRPHKSS